VLKTGTNGKANVAIRKADAGCLFNCHRDGCLHKSANPSVTIRAVNAIGASEGDIGRVSFMGGAFMKNVGILLGIPILGFLSGLLASLLPSEEVGADI
jgi:hypothetical protein